MRARSRTTWLDISRAIAEDYCASAYSPSIVCAHFCSTILRRTFSDGVSSPFSIENSRGRIAIRLIRSNCDSYRLMPSMISW